MRHLKSMRAALWAEPWDSVTKVMCNIPGHAHMVDSLLQLLWSTISIPYLAQTMLLKKPRQLIKKKTHLTNNKGQFYFFYIELNSTFVL